MGSKPLADGGSWDRPRPASATPATFSAGLHRHPPTAMATTLTDRWPAWKRAYGPAHSVPRQVATAAQALRHTSAERSRDGTANTSTPGS